MADFPRHRQLAPGPSPQADLIPPGDSPPGESYRRSSDQLKKRVSMACLACKKSKRKCTGSAPCENCRAFNRQCIFDETLDQRRRVAAKRTADEMSYYRDLLNDMLRVVRAENEAYGLRLLEIIRQDATADQIRSYIDETLFHIEGSSHDHPTEQTVNRLGEMRKVVDVEGVGPSSARPKVMDIHYLCDDVPYRVPAYPWTKVTSDSDLVSHLVSLYFTWDYPFHVFLDRDVFLAHMAKGDPKSELCSPFLVNALLTNACYFSDSEANVDPEDIATKGQYFLAEAERLRKEEPARLALAFLQGTLLLYARYAKAGNNDMGYHMLHEAIWTGEALGLIGPKTSKAAVVSQFSEDMEIAIRRTAWGLFHVDTVVHTNFLRPSVIQQVNLDRPDTDADEMTLWTPYPAHRATRPAYLSEYFNESCNLCEIARDMSQQLFTVKRDRSSVHHQRGIKDSIYARLRHWETGLSNIFSPESRPPPYIILLRMRYHTMVINLFAKQHDMLELDQDAPQTPESPPGLSPLAKNDDEIMQSSAREISRLAQLHQLEFGMNRAHQFAMYAIYVALFTMLNNEAFDLLDNDFLSMVSSFIIVANRSMLGRNLIHMFRTAARQCGQGARIREATGVSNELKSLFDEESISDVRWEEYAVGLEKLNQDKRYHGIPTEGERDLAEMLDRYESLSLGKNEIYT